MSIKLVVSDEGELVRIDRDFGNSSPGYLSWFPGDEKATLDGSFTAAELRAIADHMEKTKEPA